MTETNPNGANQYQMDPRQKLCWEYYVNPKSKTFSNAYQSAMEAGYEEATAAQITTMNWFAEKCRRVNMLGKAEKVLDEMLEMPVTIGKMGLRRPIDGEDYEVEEVGIVTTEPALIKIKQDTAKFVAERLGKDEGYSTRNEVTGKGGGPVIDGLTDQQKKKLDELLYDEQKSPRKSNKRHARRKKVPVQ